MNQKILMLNVTTDDLITKPKLKKIADKIMQIMEDEVGQGQFGSFNITLNSLTPDKA